MTSDGPTDEQIWVAYDRIEGCIPASAGPRTEAVVRQVLALCIYETSPRNPKRATTAEEIKRACPAVETPKDGRAYMRRIAGREDDWRCIPGFDLRRNRKAYDWPEGKLELLFDRDAYREGRTLPGGWTVRYDDVED